MRTASGHLQGIPTTRLGRLSVWLAVVFVLMFIINIPINLYIIRPTAGQPVLVAFYWLFVIFMLVCGLASGIFGLIAVTKRQERSPLVWFSILCGLFVLPLTLNELMQGIQYMLST